jgi:ABC-type Fe3+/spermidine/putrescine transport system ATPase subunit
MGEALRLERVCRSFGSNPPAVAGVDLTLEPGTFFCLLGPSGCGKTTLLRLIGGYLLSDSGTIILADRDVTAQPPEQRDIGMVFQNYALFPHLSARANVAFGLEVRKMPRAERERRIEAMLDRVGLAAAERGRLPRELSGGQQQRVALARALVIEPKLLLLDEPLANLDRQLREQLRSELKELQRRTGVTALFVTHDQDEALSLADRVGLMHRGRLLQIGTPREIYDRPTTAFAARFVGHANLLPIVAAESGRLRLQGGLTISGDVHTTIARPGFLMLRPEHVLTGAEAEACPNGWSGTIRERVFLGADELLQVEIAPGVELRVRRRASQSNDRAVDGQITLGIRPESLWVIPQDDSDGEAPSHATT